MNYVLNYGLFYGAPALWGYWGGSIWLVILEAMALASAMLWSGWRYEQTGETAVIRSFVMGMIFAAFPCFATYFVGQWLAAN